MDEFPYTYRIYAGGMGVVCAEDTNNDFFGPSMNSNIVSFSNTSKILKLYTLTDTEKDTPVFTFQSQITLDQSPAKVGSKIRDIHTANNSYSFRLVSSSGVQDSGEGTYGVIRADGLDSEGYSAKDTVDFVVNQIRLSASLSKVSFYLLEQPFIFFEDSVLETGIEKKVTITVTDQDNGPASVEGSFTRYDSGSDVIQVVGEANFQDIEVDVNSTTRHNYDYSFVKQGNNLSYKFDYNGVEGLTSIEKTWTDHKIFTNDDKSNRIGFADYDSIAIDSASALTFSKETGVKFFTCSPENAFATQCQETGDIPPHGLQFTQKLKSNKGVTVTVASKTIGEDNDAQTYFYFNWYCHKGRTWNYEVYSKPIIDIETIDTTEGTLYTVIAFNDSIQFSRFFTNWSYGSRFVQVFDKNDVDVDELCPEDIIFNPKEKNLVWIFSNCNRNQNLLSFEILEDGTLKFVTSRWVSSDRVTVSNKACVLIDEFVIFKSPSSPTQGGSLTSFDRDFSFTRVELSTQAYNIAKLESFECLSELDLYLTLSADGVEKPVQRQITVFRGSSLHNAMKRVLFSAYPVNEKTTSFQTYAHLDKVVILTFDENMKILDTLNVDTASPSLATIGSGIDLSKVG